MKRLVYFLVAFVAAAPLTYGQQTLRSNPSNMESFFDGEMRQHAIRSQALKKQTSDAKIDVKYYKLDLDFTMNFRGIVTMHALSLVGSLSTVTLDLVDRMTVDSIRMGGTKLSFVRGSSTVTITLDRGYTSGELLALDIYYRGNLEAELFGSVGFATHSGIPITYTVSWWNGAADWWPCKDDWKERADSVDIWVTVDSTFKVAANGKLVAVINNGNGTKTHRWEERYPIGTYSIFIAFTNYAEFTNWFKYTETDSMPVLNYVFPEHLSEAQTNLPKTIDMLHIYSNKFGLYPFIREKYGHAECATTVFKGVSNQTMPSITTFDEGIVAHELAHMWFDCMITNASDAHLWTNEGFATYCTALYFEEKYGKPSYDAYMDGHMRTAKKGVGSVYVRDPAHTQTALVYSKGAAVLHMLRHVLGDSLFFGSFRAYAEDPRFRFGATTTEDFQQVCETISGKDLGYFFSEWIYGENYPVYTYWWRTTPDTNGGYLVNVQLFQLQSSGISNPSFFTMPIDVKLKAGEWDTTVVLFNNSQSQLFRVHASHQPDTVELDPDNWILHDAHVTPFGTPLITVDTKPLYLVINNAMLRCDTTFVVRNVGLASDSLTTSVVAPDPYMAPPESATAVSPPSFALAPGDSQKVTFSARPLLMDLGSYEVVVSINSRFGQQPTFSKRIGLEKVPTDVVESSGLPKEFALSQNYPNPFNPKTVVSSQLPVASNVTLIVYDVLGRKVAVLVNERRPAGSYQDTFDASGLASGIYLYRMMAGKFVQTKKLVILK